MSNFARRIFTAAVLVPAVGVLVFLENPLFFCALVPVVSLLSVHELFAMLRRGGYKPFAVFGYVMVLALQLAAYTEFNPPDFANAYLIPAALLTLLVTGSLLAQLPRGHREANFKNVCVTLFSVLYIGWLAGFFIRLRGMPDGIQWVFLLLLLTWVYDSAAYFWGVSVGRTKLWAAVSPRKTWEGLVGGILTTVALVGVLTQLPEHFLGLPRLLPARASIGFLLCLAPAVCLAAQLGDLVESMIKRTVHVKDSGVLLPGHGGFLDKLDGFLFSAPLMYFAALAVERLMS